MRKYNGENSMVVGLDDEERRKERMAEYNGEETEEEQENNNMENITPVAEKRVRVTKPYKQLCRKWKQIAYGLAGLSLLLSFLLIQALRTIK